jgi:hypothetical protein
VYAALNSSTALTVAACIYNNQPSLKFLSAMPSNFLKILEHERVQLLLLLKLIDETILSYQNGGMLLSENENTSVNGATPGNLLQGKLELLQKYAAYNPQLNTRSKVLYIIKTENRFLHVREIARIAWQLENSKPFETYVRTISPALSMLKRMPGSDVISLEVGNSHFNTFWGCRDWVGENGEMKPQFMYSEAELSNNRKQTIGFS